MIFKCDIPECSITWASSPTARTIKHPAARTCPDCVKGLPRATVLRLIREGDSNKD